MDPLVGTAMHRIRALWSLDRVTGQGAGVRRGRTAAAGSVGGMAQAVTGRIGRWAASAGLGAFIAVTGTALHRSAPPWGMALCLAVVLTSTVAVRAWAGLLAVVGYAVAWLAVVQVLSLTGPGGDVLVPAGDSLGYVWGVGGMVVIGIACFLPGRWFRDAPAGA